MDISLSGLLLGGVGLGDLMAVAFRFDKVQKMEDDIS